MAEQTESLAPEQELAMLRQKVQELTFRNKILEQLARKDGLTELDNRRTFEEEIRREISGAIRAGQPLSVVMTDIDHFKAVNDNEGHSTGDLVLREFSGTLKKIIRQTDRICRYGGEEFIVILPKTTLDQAVGVSEKLRHRTATSVITTQDKELKITASFGVSTFSPKGPYLHESPEEIEKIIENIAGSLKDSADRAMYGAKSAGRNRTGFTDNNGEIGILEEDPKNISKMVVRYQKLQASILTHK